MQTITRSASFAASALVATTWSAMPSSATRLRVASERAVATISLHRALRARRARDRGADQAGSADQSARRFEAEGSRSLLCPSIDLRTLARMNSASALHHQPVRPPRCRPSCAGIRAGGRRRRGAGSGRGWSGTRRRPPRSGPWSSGKWIRMKFAMLGVTVEPELAHLVGQPGEPFLVVGARRLDVRGVVDRRDRRPPSPAS